MTLLCKCMNADCTEKHFADLPEATQNALMQGVNEHLNRTVDDEDFRREREGNWEDKKWPPTNMENK